MRNGQRFCSRCLAYYCDHADELDFEWSAEDEAAFLAIDDGDEETAADDGHTSPSDDDDDEDAPDEA
jgi:hypothetical protein